MDKQIHISVTQNDITQGIRKNSMRCPIALAFRRFNANCGQVRVDRCISWFMIPSHQWYEAKMPAEAARFMVEFDAGQQPETIEFAITPERLRGLD